MTREEAIELLCSYGVPQDEKRFQEAIDMAIEALSADAVPLRKDCAECALKAINQPKLDEESYEKGYTAGQFADRPKGEWIMHIDDLFPEESTQECSNCHEHETIKIRSDNFCPNCGAKMDKGGDDE